jgi:hypothetical protein
MRTSTAPIFHVTHWKAGSQWVRQVLDEAAPNRMIATSGDPNWFSSNPVVEGAVYSPVYAGLDRFRAVIPADRPQRTFAVIRDARDTAVSWYFSLRYSHSTKSPGIAGPREVLSRLSVEDGLAMVIASHLRTAIWIQRTWLESGLKVFRYEELRQRQHETFNDLFDFCQLDLSARKRRRIVERNSFERRTWWRFGRESKRSHLRKGMPGDWKNYFTGMHKNLFKAHYGDILIHAGYEKDENW